MKYSLKQKKLEIFFYVQNKISATSVKSWNILFVSYSGIFVIVRNNNMQMLQVLFPSDEKPRPAWG